MLDEKDLQAIREMLGILEEKMDEKFAHQDKRIDEKLARQKKEILSESNNNMRILLEAEIYPQLRLLAEGQETILEKLVPRSRVDDLEEELKFLKSIVRQMNEDLQALKKAN